MTVWVTAPVAVLITENESSLEFATSRTPFGPRYSAVGCRPTLISRVSLPVDRFTCETAPVDAAPVVLFDTTAVPSDSFVKSPGLAGRPPSSDTYAVEPTSTTCRGALPTWITWVSALVLVLMTPSSLTPLSAT